MTGLPITPSDITSAKRAVVVLVDSVKHGLQGRPMPLELRQDILALMNVLRKLETMTG